jgi:hypothetical protein
MKGAGTLVASWSLATLWIYKCCQVAMEQSTIISRIGQTLVMAFEGIWR